VEGGLGAYGIGGSILFLSALLYFADIVLTMTLRQSGLPRVVKKSKLRTPATPAETMFTTFRVL